MPADGVTHPGTGDGGLHLSRTTGVAGPSSVAKGRREGTAEARCGSPGETPGDELGVSPLQITKSGGNSTILIKKLGELSWERQAEA